MEIAELLSRAAKLGPDRVALLAPGAESVTYGALDALVTRLSADLRRHGVDRADRIAVVMPNGTGMALAFLAAASAGACAPLNPGYSLEEFKFYLNDLHARVLLVEDGSQSAAVEAARLLSTPVFCLAGRMPEVELRPGGSATVNTPPAPIAAAALPASEPKSPVALVLHTSGTTSRPKIVPLTHRSLCLSAQNIAQSLGLGAEDRCLNIMPLFHVHGLVGVLLTSLAAGASVVCTPGFFVTDFPEWLAESHPT